MKWQLTPKRREKLQQAANELKALLDRNPAPDFQEVQAAVDKITYEHETTKNS